MMASSARTFLASVACYNLAAMSTWIQPSLVSDYRSRLHFPSSTAGLIASAELAMMAVTLSALPYILRGRDLRSVGLAGLLITFAATVFSLYADELVDLVLGRIVTGIGYALLLIVPTVAMAGVPDPQTKFGRMYTVNLISSSALLALLPWIALLRSGGTGFVTYLGYALLMLPLVASMPKELRLAGAGSGNAAKTSFRKLLPLSAATSLLGLSYAAIWAFFIILAQKAGLTASEGGTAAAVCVFAAMVGSLTAPLLTRLVGARTLLLLSLSGVAAGMQIVVHGFPPSLFIIGGCLTLACYYLFFPTVMGIASDLDPNGGGTTLILSQVMLLLATGPYVGGLLMTLIGANGLALFAAFACLLGFLLLAFGLERPHSVVSPA